MKNTAIAILLLTALAIPAAARNKPKHSLRDKLSWMWRQPSDPAYTWMAIQTMQNSLRPLPYLTPHVPVQPVYQQNQPVHCTTQFIGDTAYTSCY